MYKCDYLLVLPYMFMMCLSVVAQIEKILEKGEAIANLSGVRKTIELGLLEGNIKEGDWVLLHTGYAISKVDYEKARQMLDAMEFAESL